MKSELEQFIESARWFGGKGRDATVSEVRRAGTLGSIERDGTPYVGIELVTLTYADAQTETYQVPVAYYAEAQDRLGHAYIGHWEVDDLGPVHAYDAMHDREVTILWLRAFAEGHNDGDLAFHRVPGHELDLSTHSTLFSGEQSNSSLMFGEDSLMKLFRKVTFGHNPDIEIHAKLTEAGSDHVAALYGWVEAPGHASTGGDPLHLAMLQQFLRTASDGWDLALASVRDLFAEADLHADEVGGDFAGESHRLGVATGEVHRTLAEVFPTHTWHADEQKALATAMRDRLDAAVLVVPALAQHADRLRTAYDAVEAIDTPLTVQRVHGDLHLGQTLRTVKGWKIVDFEGEPAKPLAERVLPDSPWRDVAGMLRSFDYAAHAVQADVQADLDDGGQIAYRAAEWAQRNQEAFLVGYLEAVRTAGDDSLTDEAGDTPSVTTQEKILLTAYEADKAVYEAVYEARNRPTWLGIPLGAVERLTAAPAPEEAP